jgi:hypothetical protein
MTPFGMAGLALLSPFLVGTIINGIIAGVCFYAFRETRLGGWRLLALAGVVRLLAQLPHLYGAIAVRTQSAASYGRFAMMLGVGDLLVTIVTSLLTIGGLYVLLDECRRLLRR